MITNEIAISRESYDELKAAEITMELYRKAILKTTRYSEWRKNPTMDGEDFLDLVALFDHNLIDEIKKRCEKEKAELERMKAEEVKREAKEGES